MYWSPSLYYKDPQDGVLSIVKTSHTHYYVVIGDGYIRKVTSSTCSLKASVTSWATTVIGLRLRKRSCVMALYRRSPRQKKNLFLHEPKFVALPPRILETGGSAFRGRPS
jgi:hypothetical protein